MPFSRLSPPALYRASQFFAALRAYLPPWAGGARGALAAEDVRLVETILPAAEQRRLFAGMPPNDRRHALAVVRTLQQAGQTHPALMQAALLHDAAKSLGQPLLHRVLIVLLEAFWPQALARLSAFPPETQIEQIRPQRRPFVIHAQHPVLGATWAEAVACEPLAVRLIARHQERIDETSIEEEERLLAALQWADNLN